MKDCYVYAAYDPSSQEIKVGISIAPERRILAFNQPIFLLAKVRGGAVDERRFHVWLKPHRVSKGRRNETTEWYRGCPQVMTVIGEMMVKEKIDSIHAQFQQGIKSDNPPDFVAREATRKREVRRLAGRKGWETQLRRRENQTDTSNVDRQLQRAR